VDWAPTKISRAREIHPDLEFRCEDIEQFSAQGWNETFDVILFTDVVGYLEDIQGLLHHIRPPCHTGTRLIFIQYNNLWEPVLTLAEKLRIKTPKPVQNWLTLEDLSHMLHLEGYETIRASTHLLCPLFLPFFSAFLERLMPFIPGLRRAGLIQFLVARPTCLSVSDEPPKVSVVVPARNERGNIASAVSGIPEMGSGTEIIFVEGGSSDGTYEEMIQIRDAHPERKIVVTQQMGKGKGDAVRHGFSIATGDILMILDADLTVPPEDLIRFYQALVEGKGDFVNGSRLVYPMDNEAMRFLNLLANHFFAKFFTTVLGQPVKDTLCGTKVLWRTGYKHIAAQRDFFGNFDPFGDFDLLFGAARLHFRIVDLPVRYRRREYGSTQIQRFAHGWLLLKMAWFALGKFNPSGNK
jgi:hypothetical protein